MKVQWTLAVSGSLMREALRNGEAVVLDAGTVFGLCAVTRVGETEPQRLLSQIKQRSYAKAYGTLGTAEDILRRVDLSAVPKDLQDLFTLQNLQVFQDVFLRFPVSRAPFRCSLNGTHQVLQTSDRKVSRLVSFFEGQYFLATSFNVSGSPSATSLVQVEKYLKEIDQWYSGRLVVSVRWQRYVFPWLFRSPGSMAIFEITRGGVKLSRSGTGEKRAMRLLRQKGIMD